MSPSQKGHPEGNEPSRCGQSMQGLREASALTEAGFLEFSLEDCVTWDPTRNWSIVFPSSVHFAAGTCILLQPPLLRALSLGDAAASGLNSGTLKLRWLDSEPSSPACYLVWCWVSCSTSLSLGMDWHRDRLPQSLSWESTRWCMQGLIRAQEKCTIELMIINKNQTPIIYTSLLPLPWALSLLILTFQG